MTTTLDNQTPYDKNHHHHHSPYDENHHHHTIRLQGSEHSAGREVHTLDATPDGLLHIFEDGYSDTFEDIDLMVSSLVEETHEVRTEEDHEVGPKEGHEMRWIPYGPVPDDSMTYYHGCIRFLYFNEAYLLERIT
ncbi:hypothetical protein LIER_16493 [Lithospermum erythrorhizon]|uniref:Uncharacterized protein n=1 Tax=Lithospermum erythrorhizon TaxID=34254 RepID=A0AAV3Q768_LITER